MRSPLDVRDFGAVGDARSDCTDAIQNALNSAAASSGNHYVHVPAGGTFLTRPLSLPGSTALEVNGVLKGMTGKRILNIWPTLAPIPTYGRDRDGAKKRRYGALLFAKEARGVTIRGTGIIDGSGSYWWDRRGQLKHGRPHLVETYNCSHVEISGVTLRDSAFWTLHPVFSSNLHIHDLIIRAPLYAPNTDGIDPDSCRHVLIERCDISCGDDHIAVKSGMNGVARKNFPSFVSEDIQIRHNVFRTGMGVTVGSETAGGVRMVQVINNTFVGDGASFSVALHVKSASQRGGVIEDIFFRNNRVHNTSAFMRLDAFGRSRPPPDGGYAATLIRRVTWAGNVYTPHERRVRSKFICPAGGAVCQELTIANNTGPERGTWQCEGIATASISNNTPAGLSVGRCMVRRRSERAGANKKQQRRRVRKFHWRSQSATWSSS